MFAVLVVSPLQWMIWRIFYLILWVDITINNPSTLADFVTVSSEHRIKKTLDTRNACFLQNSTPTPTSPASKSFKISLIRWSFYFKSQTANTIFTAWSRVSWLPLDALWCSGLPKHFLSWTPSRRQCRDGSCRGEFRRASLSSTYLPCSCHIPNRSNARPPLAVS